MPLLVFVDDDEAERLVMQAIAVLIRDWKFKSHVIKFKW